MKAFTKQYAIMLCLIFLVPAIIQAQTLEDYVAADFAARQATLDGMAERVNLLRSDSYTPEKEMAMALANQEQVDKAYGRYGTSSAAHTVYGSHYAKEIEQWVAGNSDAQLRYISLEQEFESLSGQLEALRRDPQP